MESNPSGPPAHSAKLGFREKFGYGLGDFGSNIVFQSVMMLLPLFYTDVFGLSAAAMGTMFLVVRILDAFTDPIMGAIADRTKTRWGKFRPYLLWLPIPFALLCLATFTTPDLSAGGKLVYAYVAYSLLMLTYTAINIPYCALGGVIIRDSAQRVSLNSFRFVLATLAGVLIASATMPLVNFIGKGNDQRGFQLAMGLFGLLAILAFWGCFFLVRERIDPGERKPSTVWSDIKSLARNDQWWIVVLLFFFLLMPLVLRGGAAAYYIKWFAGREDLISSFLATGAICQMLGASLASRLTKHLSIRQGYILIQIVIVAGSCGMYFLNSTQIVLMFLLYGFVQFFVQMGAPLLFTMAADTVEYGELKTGNRVTGLVFSGALFSLKLGIALGGTLLAWVLAFYGYESGENVTFQSPRAIQGVVLATTLVPAVGHTLLIPIVFFYRLNKKRCNDICIKLERRRMEDTGEAIDPAG
jgi:GPH family glycoside/pentoside/hexuronide:cation symporter